MFKEIPKSSISQKQFKVYKEWAIDQSNVSVTIATDESNQLFDTDTSTQSNGLFIHPLFNSIKSKYYSAAGNTIIQYGIMNNPALYEIERYYNPTGSMYIIDVPQSLYGEQIKKGSVVLQISGEDEFIDNSYGQIISANPTYILISYDVASQIMIINDGADDITVTLSYLDLVSGIAVFTISGDTDTYYVTQIDFETAIMVMSQELIFSDTVVSANKKGNVFYDDGLIVMTAVSAFTNYELSYRSIQTIYETEVLISANKGEFNYSQNPSAVDVTLSGSYSFTSSAITNVSPAKEYLIKEVKDISQRTEYYGSITGSDDLWHTGSWDDYYNFKSANPTGSYLTTYVTTIGLYDNTSDMVAVAKLPKPIKILPDYNISFLLRFDT